MSSISLICEMFPDRQGRLIVGIINGLTIDARGLNDVSALNQNLETIHVLSGLLSQFAQANFGLSNLDAEFIRSSCQQLSPSLRDHVLVRAGLPGIRYTAPGARE